MCIPSEGASCKRWFCVQLIFLSHAYMCVCMYIMDTYINLLWYRRKFNLSTFDLYPLLYQSALLEQEEALTKEMCDILKLLPARSYCLYIHPSFMLFYQSSLRFACWSSLVSTSLPMNAPTLSLSYSFKFERIRVDTIKVAGKLVAQSKCYPASACSRLLALSLPTWHVRL